MIRVPSRFRRRWSVRFARGTWVGPALTAALTLTPAGAAGQQVVQPGSVHHQNVQTAIKFLRDHGETEAADQIQDLLDTGQIEVDPDVEVNGETSFDGTVSLSPTVAGPTSRSTAASPSIRIATSSRSSSLRARSITRTSTCIRAI